ncbi:pleckstrin homology-like domain family A member 2 [Acomys russatus]|uniref:pleckstrin homology-like domain family A member 2 n=1 Tax=Acomys russatus TaxID=60746 RepID=UPI0021E2E3AE|nr:pleckstrin homology-like domain family A member 2 [Acomys russatus]
MASKVMATSENILREGELEKRSDGLFQVWKKKRCVLTADRLRLFSGSSGRVKELFFHSILKVDCVEHTSKYVYFTIVTTFYKEIDFRCASKSCWNAAITVALIDFQNRRAVEDVRRYRFQRSASEEPPESRKPRSLDPDARDQLSREPAHAAALDRSPGAQRMDTRVTTLLFTEEIPVLAEPRPAVRVR